MAMSAAQLEITDDPEKKGPHKYRLQRAVADGEDKDKKYEDKK